MPIDIVNFVDVQIAVQQTPTIQPAFGIPLILGVNGTFTPRSVSVSSIEQVLELGGITSSTDEYKAALAVFSQNPRVPSLRIGRQLALVAQVETIVFSAAIVTGNTVAITVNGDAITQAFDTSNAQTLTALAAQIAAVDGIGTAVSNGTDTITVTADSAGIPFTLASASVTGGASQATITLTITTENHGVQEDLAEISLENNQWYGLIFCNRTQLQVEQAAAYIEAVTKIFLTASDDTDIIDPLETGDIASVFQDNSYFRSGAFYNADEENFPDAGVFGRMFPYKAGSANYAFKTVAGAEADNLTQNQYETALSKNANVYITSGSVDTFQKGQVGSGEYFDIVSGIDLLTFNIEVAVYAVLVAQNKVPYTDAGIQSLVSVIRAELEKATDTQNWGLLVPGTITVSAPKAADVSSSDKANRILNDVTFTATLAGAIDKTVIRGTVSF